MRLSDTQPIEHTKKKKKVTIVMNPGFVEHTLQLVYSAFFPLI